MSSFSRGPTASCRRCKQHKVRCVRMPVGEQCERCVRMGLSCEEAAPSRQGKRSRSPPLDMLHGEDPFVLVTPSAELLAAISPNHGCQVAFMHGLFGSGVRVSRQLLLLFLRDWAATAICRNSYDMLHDTMRLGASCAFHCSELLKNLENRLCVKQPPHHLVARVENSTALTYARRHAVGPDGNLVLLTNSKWDEQLAPGRTMRDWWGVQRKEILPILIHPHDHVNMYHGIGRLMSQLVSHIGCAIAKGDVLEEEKPKEESAPRPLRTSLRARLSLQCAAAPGSCAPPTFKFVPVYHEGTLSNPRPCHSPAKTSGIAPASAMRAPDAVLRYGLSGRVSARAAVRDHAHPRLQQRRLLDDTRVHPAVRHASRRPRPCQIHRAIAGARVLVVRLSIGHRDALLRDCLRGQLLRGELVRGHL